MHISQPNICLRPVPLVRRLCARQRGLISLRCLRNRGDLPSDAGSRPLLYPPKIHPCAQLLQTRRSSAARRCDKIKCQRKLAAFAELYWLSLSRPCSTNTAFSRPCNTSTEERLDELNRLAQTLRNCRQTSKTIGNSCQVSGKHCPLLPGGDSKIERSTDTE